ncbi:hydroquinone glucosyltransferase-like protein, partial [Trifolium pratense]
MQLKRGKWWRDTAAAAARKKTSCRRPLVRDTMIERWRCGVEIERCFVLTEKTKIERENGGTLSQRQINELAFGLELSDQRFIWVVRAPSDSVSATYLEDANDDDPLKFLPKGIVERTKGKGFILPSWAPQVEILKHNSV